MTSDLNSSSQAYSTELPPTILAAPDPRSFSQSDPSREPINILIVDDEVKNLTVLEAILDDPAYRLIKAQTADEALLALLVDQFAVLILDIRMPGVTGIELAHMIRQRKKTSQVPIIFLTAYYNEDQHILAGYSAGAVDYLHKPVNTDILRSKVAVFAELFLMQREIRKSNHALLEEVTQRRRTQDQLRELNETLEQRIAERTEALRASAALLQTVTENASVGLASLDLECRYMFANAAYSRMFDMPVDILGQLNSDVMPPIYNNQAAPLLLKALSGERGHFEFSRRSAIGERSTPSHYTVIYEPEHDSGGRVIGVVVVVFDITLRKGAEEQISLLLGEVNHRAKNLLGVVLAIARQTKAPNQEEFIKRFSDRIQALSSSHELLAKSQWQSIAISELVPAQLSHFQDLIENRILIDGPALNLSVAGAQCIGMIVHELATNAAKYGALSNEVGKVDVAWQLKPTPENLFAMSWTESGGPPVTIPTHRGFGSTVIKTMTELNLNGKVQLDFAATGLCWRLECPTTNLLENA